MKNQVRVEILGREYTIRSDEGEERVRRIAQYLDEKLKKISEASRTTSTLNVAILAALDIANEYFEAQEGRTHLNRRMEDIEKKTGRLIDLINARIH